MQEIWDPCVFGQMVKSGASISLNLREKQLQKAIGLSRVHMCTYDLYRKKVSKSDFETDFESAADRLIDRFPALSHICQLGEGGAVNILMTIVENSPAWPDQSPPCDILF